MLSTETVGVSRRDALKDVGKFAAVAAVAGAVSAGAYAAGNDTIQIALIGCGGRGTGAIKDALITKQGPTKLVAMADVFEDKLAKGFKFITSKLPDQVDVPRERQFIGFDAYKNAIDCLKPGDIAIMATPPAFRWVHFKYAIEKGVHVFMEKPLTVDGPTSKKMLALADEADKKGIKAAVGLMCRHSRVRQEMQQRIQKGQIGDIMMMRAYRMQGIIGSCFTPKHGDDKMSELLYQIRNFHSFLWASGGAYSDFLIHNVDECCMMKDAWPVSARASGGRHIRGVNVDQNFDSYSVEYTFADGAKFFLEGRNIPGCQQEFSSFVHGTKGSGVISEKGHSAAGRLYKSQDMTQAPIWDAGDKEPVPYEIEWVDFMEAIRQNKPYNEVKRGTEASLVTSMGRMAAHTGQVITRDDILNSDHEFAPEVDRLTMESAAPIQVGNDGKYPIPMPGAKKKREF